MTSLRIKGIWRRIGLISVIFSSVLAGCAPVVNAAKLQKRDERAEAIFAARCKNAGEKIYRTADDVKGVYLLKIRPAGTNYGDQFKLDDPYGHDSGGDLYILNFLRGFYHQRTGSTVPGAPARLGYLYVEAVDSANGVRYRYTPRVEEPWQTDKAYLQGYLRFVFDKAVATGDAPRYGITYDDISTHEDREHWIAGSSLKVLDLKTNEVIAERVGYMIDDLQGSQAGGRSPWLLAANHACPGFQFNPLKPLTLNYGGGASAQPGQTLTFIEKVIKPGN